MAGGGSLSASGSINCQQITPICTPYPSFLLSFSNHSMLLGKGKTISRLVFAEAMLVEDGALQLLGRERLDAFASICLSVEQPERSARPG